MYTCYFVADDTNISMKHNSLINRLFNDIDLDLPT